MAEFAGSQGTDSAVTWSLVQVVQHPFSSLSSQPDVASFPEEHPVMGKTLPFILRSRRKIHLRQAKGGVLTWRGQRPSTYRGFDTEVLSSGK